MMKHFLVPTDFSDYSSRALRYAAALAAAAGGRITLVHVSDGTLSEEEVQAMLLQFKTVHTDENLKVDCRTAKGSVASGTLEAARAAGADTIVMGTLGTTGLKTVFMGTQAAAVINASTLPVIAVPFNYAWHEPKRLLLAVEENTTPEFFGPALQLAGLVGAMVTVASFKAKKSGEVHIAVVDELVSGLRQLHPDIAVSGAHLEGRDFQSDLRKYVEEQRIDLLVMATHHRGFLGNLFHFSATREMVYHSTVPLMALQAGER